MALTSRILGALLQVNGRANEGGVIEIVPGSRLLIDAIVDEVEDGALLDEITTQLEVAAAAAETAAAAAELAQSVSGLTGEDAAVATLVGTPSSETATALSATYGRGVSVTAAPFGAVGNGVADATAAIQAALTYAGGVASGTLRDVLNAANPFAVCVTVYIPGGTYKITDSLVKPNGVSIEMAPDAILKASGSGMNTKPLLKANIESVPDQHTYISGGILDCADAARDGIDLPWFAHLSIENVQVYEPRRHGVILGDPAAPSTSYEGHVIHLDHRRRRGSNPATGSTGLWLRNASDCETDRVTINGVDIGIQTDLGGTTHTQAHVWNHGGSTPPTISFLDNTAYYATTYVDCKADSPTLYGFHLAGGWGKIIGGTVYANTNVPDNVMIGVQIGGSQGLVDILDLNIIGSDDHRIAVDVAGPALYSNIRVRNYNVVTENMSNQTRQMRMRLSEPGGGTELSIQKQNGNTARFAQFLRYGDSAIVGEIDRYGAYRGPNTQPAIATGQYFYPVSANGAATSASLTNGVLRLTPWVVDRTIAIDRLAADIATVGDAASVLRLGIYADDGTGRPGARVLDAGTIAGNSATVQQVTVSQTLTPGVYWIGGVVQGVTTTQPTVRIATSWSPPIRFAVGSTLPAANNAPIAHTMSGVTGALPTTFVSDGVTGNVPRLILRAA